jgi:hypothetical protein
MLKAVSANCRLRPLLLRGCSQHTDIGDPLKFAEKRNCNVVNHLVHKNNREPFSSQTAAGDGSHIWIIIVVIVAIFVLVLGVIYYLRHR